MDNKNCGIYKITSPTGAVYIGQSINISARRRYYKAMLCKDQPRIFNSLKKHGFENHLFEIICVCERLELNDKEKFFIKLHDSCNSIKGMNLRSGGNGRGIVSSETLQKCSMALKGKPAWNKGKRWSNEIKEKISISVKNSESHKKAINSIDFKQRKKDSSTGRKYTLETRLKIGLAHKGKKLTECQKRTISNRNRGAGNASSKLKEADVLKIKELLKLNKTQKEIANMFGVGKTTIYSINSNKKWKHVI